MVAALPSRPTVFLCLLFTALLGCSDDAPDDHTAMMSQRPLPVIVTDTVEGVRRGAFHAVQMPFEDLNLTRDKIPPLLQKMAGRPYALPDDMSCGAMHREIALLDDVLGADVDVWRDPAKRDSYADKGISAAQGHAVGMIENQVSIIPYRGVVRQVTGAEKHARKVATAYEVGRLRRAFFKGLGVAKGCRVPQWPAPVPLPKKEQMTPPETVTSPKR